MGECGTHICTSLTHPAITDHLIDPSGLPVYSTSIATQSLYSIIFLGITPLLIISDSFGSLLSILIPPVSLPALLERFLSATPCSLALPSTLLATASLCELKSFLFSLSAFYRIGWGPRQRIPKTGSIFSFLYLGQHITIESPLPAFVRIDGSGPFCTITARQPGTDPHRSAARQHHGFSLLSMDGPRRGDGLVPFAQWYLIELEMPGSFVQQPGWDRLSL